LGESLPERGREIVRELLDRLAEDDPATFRRIEEELAAEVSSRNGWWILQGVLQEEMRLRGWHLKQTLDCGGKFATATIGEYQEDDVSYEWYAECSSPGIALLAAFVDAIKK
jgi:hypothetical protein